MTGTIPEAVWPSNTKITKFEQQLLMGYRVKCFSEVKVDNICLRCVNDCVPEDQKLL